MSLRQLFQAALGGVLTLAAAFAAPAGEGSAGDELPPELAALLAAQPTWSTSTALQAGFGYKDNILLSSAAREASEFVRYAAEAFVWRLPRGHTDFSAFLNVEQTRYTSAESVEDEAQAFAHLEWRYRLGARGKLTLGGHGYYLDEVFDVSDTDIRRLVAELKVRGAVFGPTLRWSFLRGGFAEAKAFGKREKFEDGANDSRAGQGALRVGWLGRRAELSLGAALMRRRFDRREQYSSGGQPVPFTRLDVDEEEVEFRAEVTWDAAARWKTITRVRGLVFRDNGDGFFNYHEKKFVQELAWSGRAWKVGVEGAATRHDFDVQTVGFGISPPARVEDEYDARLRLERTISKSWSVYAEYHWERSRSNDPLASYRVNEGLLGARWSWDK